VDMDRTRWSDDEKLECLSNDELLNHPDTASSRSIHKVTFKLPKGTHYESGDHVCVHPMNSEAMIKRFLKLFEHELTLGQNNPLANDMSTDECLAFMVNQLFDLKCIQEDEMLPADVFFATPTTLNSVLKNYLDLSLSSRNISDLVNIMKRFLDDLLDSLEGRSKEEKETVETSELVLDFLEIATQLDDAPDAASHAKDAIIARFPTVVGLLEHFKPLFLDDFTTKELGWDNSSQPLLTLPEVLVCLPRLQPRYYSISSSNLANADEVSITVGVLTTTTSAGVIMEGVCSHYLAGLEPGMADRAKLSISKSTFRLPADTTAPLIMVGAGTGLAPMMGFLQDRYLAKQGGATLGPIYLFFGCRTENDIIYKDILCKYQEEGLIDLRLALSRPPDGEKKYVQHKLADMKKDLCDLLNIPTVHYYVCGDASMAASCNESCVQVLREFGPTSRVWAVQNLTRLRLQGRWQSDVWGIVAHFEESKKVLEQRRKSAAKIWLNRLKGGEDDDDE
jgi:sulfite reductase alpha subunit-like flavoprotein